MFMGQRETQRPLTRTADAPRGASAVTETRGGILAEIKWQKGAGTRSEISRESVLQDCHYASEGH